YDSQDIAGYNGPHDADDFILDTSTGKLFFPEYYQTPEATHQDVTIALTVWVDAVDETHTTQENDRPTINHGAVLQNTAQFTSLDAGGNANNFEDTANVTFIKPQ